MSLTAGFDLVFELSDSTLERLFFAGLPQNQNLPISGPVELPRQDAAFAGLKVSVYMILEQTIPEFFSTDNNIPSIRIKIAHDKTSIEGLSPQPICPLKGVFTVEAPITLGKISCPTPVAPTCLQAQIDLSNPTITHSFDNPQIIDSAVPSSSGLVSAMFANQVGENIRKVIGDGIKVFGPVIGFDPTRDGTITPMVVTRAELKHLENGLAFFFNLFNNTKNNGNINNKTHTDIPPTRDVALHLSPEAFRRLVFCPAIGAQQNIPVGNLPSVCGTGQSFSHYVAQADTNIDITHIQDTLEFGRIRIDGKYKKSSFCYEATGSFAGAITFPDGLYSKYSVLETNSSVHVEWYCDAAAAIIGALTGGAAFGVFAQLGLELFLNIAFELKMKSLQSGFSSIASISNSRNIGVLNGISFNKFPSNVSPEGITIPGTVDALYNIYHPQQQDILLSGVVTVQPGSRKVIDQGNVSLKTPCESTEHSYPWTLSEVTEVANYDIISKGYTRPFGSVQWQIVVFKANAAPGTGDVFPVHGQGDIELEVDTVMPGINGEVTLRQKVLVGYNTTNEQIILTNKTPQKGTYSLTIELNAVDCGGQKVFTWHTIGFTGLILEIGGGWNEKWEKCIRELVERYRKNEAKLYNAAVPFIEKVDRPPPDRFKAFLDAIIQYADHQTYEIIGLTKLAHAETVSRVQIEHYAEFADVHMRAMHSKEIAQIDKHAAVLGGRVQSLKAQLESALAEFKQAEDRANQMKGIQN